MLQERYLQAFLEMPRSQRSLKLWKLCGRSLVTETATQKPGARLSGTELAPCRHATAPLCTEELEGSAEFRWCRQLFDQGEMRRVHRRMHREIILDIRSLLNRLISIWSICLIPSIEFGFNLIT